MNKNDINVAHFIKITLVTLYEYHYNRDPKLSLSTIEDLAEEMYHNWSHSMMLNGDMRGYFEATLKELKEKYRNL
jgi:hypothetical protein